MTPGIALADRLTIERQLGRAPRSVVAVETRCPAGHPQVIRTHPLLREGPEPRPFPTLFWLTCPALHAAVARLEARGWILRLEELLRRDVRLYSRHVRDHQRYVLERWGSLSPVERAWVRSRGWGPLYLENGIGGTRRRESLKCLHLHLAFHLARGSALGKILSEQDGLSPCGAECSSAGRWKAQSDRGFARQENAPA